LFTLGSFFNDRSNQSFGEIFFHCTLFWGGQRPLVPFLLLGLPFFSDYSFWSTTLLTGMTGIPLHMQWPLTSQLHGSVSQREQLFFLLRIKLHVFHCTLYVLISTKMGWDTFWAIFLQTHLVTLTISFNVCQSCMYT
jgi:hypothetical protein